MPHLPDNPLDLRIPPDAAALQRLTQDVTHAMAQLPFVRGVSLFGSLAAGTSDAWSDIDMFVACEGGPAGAWAAQTALCHVRPVVFHRPFSDRDRPSGRYWFAGESPFHRLDISFDPCTHYLERIQGQPLRGHAITAKQVVAWREATPPQTLPIIPAIAEISPCEDHIGDAVRKFLERFKGWNRGHVPRHELDNCCNTLARLLAELPPTEKFACGDPLPLVHACMHYYATSGPRT